VLADLDHAFIRLRRLVAKPPAGQLPVADCRVDIAKALACEAIADLSAAGPVSVKDVAGYLDLERSTASRLLLEAEGVGLLRREPHPHDRRSTAVVLTDIGQQVVAATRPVRLDFLQHVTDDWEPDDLARFAALVGRFAAAVDARRETFGCAAGLLDGPDQSVSTGTASPAVASTATSSASDRTSRATE
jgi:DNA-binding MarR family transcriptional regulator